MDLNEILVFARVVQAGSFTSAAAELGMPKSTVSRKVSDLEERLKSRLLQRTTRKLSLTDVGRTYYDYCARIVGEIEDGERAVSRLQESPRGLLRVTAPVNVAFLGLIVRSLGSARWFLVATPAYLKRRGRPRSPDDLKKHDCLLFGPGIDNAGVRLENADTSVQVAVSARLMVTDMDVLHAVAAAGLGIALLPASVCAEDLRARRLERVLPDWNAPSTPVHVVYPSTRHLSPKVKTFVEHLHERMTPPPWEVGPLQ